MVLTYCTDLTPADWIAASDAPWDQLVGFGPACFPAYARLLFVPDPTYEGQRETDVEGEEPSGDRLRVLLEALATDTETPHDCYVCVWDGYAEGPCDAEADAALVVEDDADPRTDPHAGPGVASPSTSTRTGPASVPLSR